MILVIFSIDEHIIVDGQYSRALGHDVIHPHLEDILWHFLSLKGTHRNQYLPRWVLNIIRSEASSVGCIPTECLVAVHFGESGGSCEGMGYLLEGWSLVVLTVDGFVQVLGVKAYPQHAICLFGVHQAADPRGGLSLLGDDSLLDHLC